MPIDTDNISEKTGIFLDRVTGDLVIVDEFVEVMRIDKNTRSVSWVGGTSTVVRTEKISLTADEVKALAASPKTLVAAQGSNKLIGFMGAYLVLRDDGTDYDNASGDGDLVVKHVDGDGVAVSEVIEAAGFIDASGEVYHRVVPLAAGPSTTAQVNNTALVLYNDGAEFTTGTRTLDVFIGYCVHDVG